jgi:hypothetical protein
MSSSSSALVYQPMLMASGLNSVNQFGRNLQAVTGELL